MKISERILSDHLDFSTIAIVDFRRNVLKKKVDLYISHKGLKNWKVFLYTQNISSFFSFELLIIDATTSCPVLELKSNPSVKVLQTPHC
jgi:hypothetical protein